MSLCLVRNLILHLASLLCIALFSLLRCYANLSCIRNSRNDSVIFIYFYTIIFWYMYLSICIYESFPISRSHRLVQYLSFLLQLFTQSSVSCAFLFDAGYFLLYFDFETNQLPSIFSMLFMSFYNPIVVFCITL